MAESKEIRQTYTNLKAVGILREKDLRIENRKFDDGADYNTLRGSIVISVDGNEHKFRLWVDDHFRSLNDEGKHKGNRTYDDVANLIDAEVGDMIELSLKAERFNDYVNQKGTLSSIDDITVNNAKVVPGDTHHKFEGKIEGVVYSIFPEIVKEEPTGRLIVTFVGVGYGQKALPHTLYVEEGDAEYFQSEYEVGSCCVLDIEVATKTYGATKPTGGWGRRAEVSSGFTRVEWIVIGGDAAYTEERVNNKGEKLFIEPKEIKALMEARDIMLEQIEKEGYKGGKGKSEPKIGLKSMKPDVDLSDIECPF